MFQIGLPPARIDILSGITGVAFDEAWSRRLQIRIGTIDVPVLSKTDFVTNKKAVGRPRDLLDMALLDDGQSDVDS